MPSTTIYSVRSIHSLFHGLLVILFLFSGGFALATVGYFVMLRGDVLQVTQNIEETFIPAAAVLKSDIARLERRVEELEKAGRK